jgi:hypothetical protein
MAGFPPYQRDARSKGIPQLGAGAIYPVPESDIFIDPIPLKPWWRRAYGLDVGWNKTAAAWIAYDSDADVVYVTHEYERSMAEPNVHAGAIRLRGKWIPGVIDPASRGRAQKDGDQLLGLYQNLGLHLSLANNAVEAGLFTVFQRMTTGRLKIFNNCIGIQREFRIYRRDERGHVVKSNDHLMDALRYSIVSGIAASRMAPDAGDQFRRSFRPANMNVARADYNPFSEVT